MFKQLYDAAWPVVAMAITVTAFIGFVQWVYAVTGNKTSFFDKNTTVVSPKPLIGCNEYGIGYYMSSTSPIAFKTPVYGTIHPSYPMTCKELNITTSKVKK